MAPRRRGQLGTLDIDLEEIAAGEIQAVDGNDRHALALLVFAQAEAAEIVRLVVVDRGDDHGAGAIAGGGVMAVDIGQAVERDVRAEGLKDDALRLDGVNEAVHAHVLGQGDGVGADIGAGFDDRGAGADELLEEVGFVFGELAELGERLADVNIVAVVEEEAVAGAVQAVKAGGGDAKLRGTPRAERWVFA